nr:Ig-like domain-containing protein [Eubacterium sp.]
YGAPCGQKMTRLATVTNPKTVKKTNTDKKDVAGSSYAPLKLKATSKGKTVTLKWSAQSKADGYIIYGAPCGQKMTRLATVTNPKTVKKTFKKLKKGKYYKYVVVAYKKAGDGSNRVISKSKSVHCATPGGKKGNPTGISVKTKMTVKKGKKVKIKAKLLKKGKVATHIAKLRYESSNVKIAAVDKNGYLKAKKKGTVTVYVYTQNGIAKTIKVKVK